MFKGQAHLTICGTNAYFAPAVRGFIGSRSYRVVRNFDTLYGDETMLLTQWKERPPVNLGRVQNKGER